MRHDALMTRYLGRDARLAPREQRHPASGPLASVPPERWPEDIRVAFEERAAIREFDGGQPRDVAEREARAEILRAAAAETSRDERKTA